MSRCEVRRHNGKSPSSGGGTHARMGGVHRCRSRGGPRFWAQCRFVVGAHRCENARPIIMGKKGWDSSAATLRRCGAAAVGVAAH